MEPCSEKASLKAIMELVTENSKQTALLTQSQQHVADSLNRYSGELKVMYESVSLLVSEVKELRILISEIEKDLNNLGSIVRYTRDKEIPRLKEKDYQLERELSNLKSSMGDISISDLDKRLTASETIITGIKIVASGMTLAIIGIAAAAIFGGP